MSSMLLSDSCRKWALIAQTLGPGIPSPGGPLLPGGPLGPSVPCEDKSIRPEQKRYGYFQCLSSDFFSRAT